MTLTSECEGESRSATDKTKRWDGMSFGSEGDGDGRGSDVFDF